MLAKKLANEDLVVVADLGRVRAMRVVRGEANPVEDVHLVEVFARRLERGGEPIRDPSGRLRKDREAMATEVGLGEEHGQEWIRDPGEVRIMADIIREVVTREGASCWLLVAPQEILPSLERELPRACRESLGRRVGADLALEGLAKLQQRFCMSR